MNSLLTSTGVVALAEMGDKTQLLAFLLAARFRKPVPIIAGILVAIWIGQRRWEARGGRPYEVSDIALWAVPFGLVGGRIYQVSGLGDRSRAAEIDSFVDSFRLR